MMADFLFLGSKLTVDGDCNLERKGMTNLDCIKMWGHHFADKGLYSQSYDFSNSYVWM